MHNIFSKKSLNILLGKYEITFEGHHSLLLTKHFTPPNIAIFSNTLWCYCEYFFLLAKYKGILYKIMNGDPNYYFMFSK